jgi:hypothetical protein
MVETPNRKLANDAAKATIADRAACVVLIPATLVGGLPVFAKMFGYEFLPAQTWVGGARVASYGFALATAWAMAHLLFWSPFMEARTRRLGRSMPATWIKIIGVVLGPVIASQAVVVGLPLLQAVIMGGPISLTYVVENASGFSDSKCPTEIELTSMPIGFDGACGFPEEFREQLKPGMLIELTGRGTANGLFYHRIHIPNPG